MGEWHKTICNLCPTNCGIEVLVEENRFAKVRGDKDNPRSGGYICRKGVNIQSHLHNKQRLTHPMKRTGNGFEKISWEQAFEEISEKIKSITGKNGGRSIAFAGEPGQYARPLLAALGSQNYYTSLAQELTGEIWVHGEMFNNPGLGLASQPDYDQTDMLLIIGWNPMMSHMMPQAPGYLKRFSKSPDKLLVVVDPRRSETARLAHIHLPLRPGTDALLNKAMIAVILQEGWHNRDYIAKYVRGFDKILPWFQNFDAKAAIDVCQLDYNQVREVCRLFATRKSSLHSGLGIEMSRHSTATSYLEVVLEVICGRFGVPGGNINHESLLHTRPPAAKPGAPVYKTPATGYAPIMGMLPPNALPEEIMSDNTDRLRALIVCATNPLRSWADTKAFEKSFRQLELLVTIDIAMTETATLSHYVLPSQSAFEYWVGCGVSMSNTYPGIFFQVRQPLLKPTGEAMDTYDILLHFADKLGLIPPLPDSLEKTSKTDRMKFGAELTALIKSNPTIAAALPFVLGKTLGKAMGSVKLADIWWNLYTMPENLMPNIERAGFKRGPQLTEELFKAILDHPEGLWAGRSDIEHHLTEVNTPDKLINIYLPEMADWIPNITDESEARALEPDKNYPLILSAGSHIDVNANSKMRDPAWNEGRRACELSMHPQDAALLKLIDGEKVKVTTKTGSAEIELKVTDSVRQGQVIIPHGFGLDYNGQVYGINVNYLTKNTHRDKIAGTPFHKFVRCRVEKLIKK